jgi:N-acetylglucosaminyldiphosphoundecaprenol N-acetyl-beta-D-mannosaminyltransferase
VNALNLPLATQLVVDAAGSRRGGYVCFCDVNSATCAHRDAQHKARLNQSFLTTPDGMPIVWLGRQAGHSQTGRVYGPDLLMAVAGATQGTELTHFFYGAGPGTAPLLAQKLLERFPTLKVAGTYSPPFRPLNSTEEEELARHLDTLRPHFFWVGLSTPKQERFMAETASKFPVGLSLGVGAAFDFLSGRVRQAPLWLQRSGFEWLWRLAHEPRRLGPRYLKNNPMFILRVIAQVTRLRTYD